VVLDNKADCWHTPRVVTVSETDDSAIAS
jgi:hypothetical protein